MAQAPARGLPLAAPGGNVSAAKPAPSSVIQWVIGHAENINSQGDSFRGSLDDMRVYNRQLGLKDVEALYQSYNQPPALQARAGANTITLSWPTWATDFQLQSADALLGAPWNNVTNVPAETAFSNTVTLNLSPGNKFYRLRRQLP